MRKRTAQERARRLRSLMTDAERKLWYRLRHRQLDSHRFRRQVPISPFIADFACVAQKLIVEVDGGQHRNNPHDAARDAYLRRGGWHILRFWDNDALMQTDAVLEVILKQLSTSRDERASERTRHSPPS